jgi:hypothetical protein
MLEDEKNKILDLEEINNINKLKNKRQKLEEKIIGDNNEK